VSRITVFLKITPRELLAHYGTIMWNRVPGTRAFVPSLGLGFPCGFLAAGRCRIYPVRPLGCRLFPEAPAWRQDADRELYRASGYPCFNRGVSVPPSRSHEIERLLELQREEARETAELFRNGDSAYALSPVEVEMVVRGLEGVSPMERNARRRELCLARIPETLRDRAHTNFLAVLDSLDRSQEDSGRAATARGGRRCAAL